MTPSTSDNPTKQSAPCNEPGQSTDRHERMSRVDTAWLRMDNDANLMMIVGVWLLDRPVSRAEIEKRLQDTFLKYPRFRQRVVSDALGAAWVEDRPVDWGYHLKVQALVRHEGRSEQDSLQALCGHLATVPLDTEHPLWQFHLVPDYEGGCALVARIHHCIADGIALISVMMSITDGGKAPPQRRRRAEDSDVLTEFFTKPLAGLTIKAIGLYGGGVARSLDWLAKPDQPLQGGVEAVSAAYQVVSDVSAMLLMQDDSPTRLKGKPSGRKRVAWGQPLPLDQVKAVGKVLNVSVNDVLLACVAGAIGAYLRQCGETSKGKEIRAMVPVNLRPLSKAWKLGNRFGLAPLVLPIGIDQPVERVYAVHQRMNELKGSYQPLLAFAVLAVAGLLIKPAQDALLGMFARKATAVMTNVPGPAQALSFCGAKLRQTMFWVPASGDIGVGVSILSYAGGVQFGLIVDEHFCPHPEHIISRFEPEFEKLLTMALMLPWGHSEH